MAASQLDAPLLWEPRLEACLVSPHSPHSLSHNTGFLRASHKSPIGLIRTFHKPRNDPVGHSRSGRDGRVQEKEASGP